MKTGERAQAILSEFATQYLFVVMEDGEARFGVSDPAFARAVLPDLEDAINKLEHKAAKQKAREQRDATTAQPPPADSQTE